MSVTNLSAELSPETVSRIRWFGWFALLAIALPWIAWVSSRAVISYVLEEREQQHFEQLREDLGEVADDVAEVKQLLQPSKRFASRED